jgi:hypothetical protein
MSEPLAHLYALALRALEEQERRAEALRGRLGPVLAAAALGASLLGGPEAPSAPRSAAAGAVPIALTLVGLGATLAAVAYVMSAGRRMPHGPDAQRLTTALASTGALDEPTRFYPVMIEHLHRHAAENRALFDRLHAAFTAMLCGILLMLCGLALAALVG